MLHFLSGAFIGIIVFLWAQKFFSVELRSLKIIFMAITGAFVVGIIWEIYELNTGHTSFSDGIFFAFDTISDLILDIFGGFFGALYARSFLPRQNEQ